MNNFPFYKQLEAKDYGPTCLRIISKHYGKSISIVKLRSLSENTREGSSLLNISDASEKIGFRSLGIKSSSKKLIEINLPCILGIANLI
ncbi:cysteine peptidase family C39 domain-containing protein [Tenacibaculum finnmarkense]|uniref:cysteine peptidase family C39 domain-containing protein n=1 Tax=Tenacibaculum finnmarkense TaxID=2781243 RepID=UPI00350EADFE|nr:hypothetical protein [Tenacibaculum finnmarkense genomovar finnmarkense]MCG8724242.1 peptidase [Tenacibaculum finnmarkense]MCG8742580.1 peptidase [Tenacibaculum finnmarkense]MCG8765962.1 peptidase [Tenacibaculum finnmarkense]MCG8778926.1 peptidase [Tenacibaculum finnmarkense]